MASLFIATLLFSVVGLVALIWAKHWELTTGRVILGGVRPQVGQFFHVVLFWIERVLPALARGYSRLFFREALAFLHRGTAALVLWVENLLERILHSVRHTTDVHHVHSAAQASAFLREVAAHKKQLLETRVSEEQRGLEQPTDVPA